MPPPPNLARVWLPSGIPAGTFRDPAAAEAVLCVRAGNGWTTDGGTTITMFNSNTSAVVGAKVGWAARRDDATYELLVVDD